MQRDGKVLAKDVSGSATTDPITWVGGRSALIVLASAYDGTTGFLQILGPDGSTWIDINASKFSANGVTSYDLPAGQYRLNLGSSTSGLYASLVTVPY